MKADNRENIGMMTLAYCPPTVAHKCGTSSQKTVVALGMFRGGTTMLSHILERLGVNMMPDGSTSPVRECLAVRDCVMEKDWTRYECLVRKYNAEHDIWGYKFPGVWETPRAFKPLRNPMLIVSHRDPVAIVTREAKHGITWTIREILKKQTELMNVGFFC